VSADKTLPPLRDVIARFDLRAKKSLGQNFLLDQNITDKIVRIAGDLSGLQVFEVGPGPGGLTRSLLKSDATSVWAIEYDSRAVQAIQDLQGYYKDRLYVIEADALATDLRTLGRNDRPRAVIANLPYNIATPLLVGLLAQIYEDSGAYDRLALMFQKEVAQRITAKPHTKTYGRLSVLSQWLCDVKILCDIPPSAFTPPPKVTSSVVLLKPKQTLAQKPAFHAVEVVTAAAFGQRRKMIRSSLKAYLSRIEALGIDPQRRGETLSVEEFLAIAG